MRVPTHVNFLGEEITGEFTPLEILEILDQKIVQLKKSKEGV